MAKLKSIKIQGKDYVTVNERLKEFRSEHPTFGLVSDLVDVNDKHALIKAKIITPSGFIIAEGTAYEEAGSSFINKTSHVENAETSAWGRALGNFGIGVDTSVASAEEVANAVLNKDKPAKSKQPTVEQVMESLTSCNTQDSLRVVWGAAMKYKWTDKNMEDLETCKKNVSERIFADEINKIPENE